MQEIGKSDWQVFKQIYEQALETYCQKALEACVKAASESEISVRDRYVAHYQMTQQKDKELGLIFDGLSRSKACFQLKMIRQHDLASEALVQKLSPEFEQMTNPARLGYR